MTIITQVRNYTDSTVEQGKSTFAAATDLLLSLPTGTKELATGAVTAVRRQAYVTLGASDAMLAAITKRGEELPGQAKQTAVRLLGTTLDRLAQAKDLAASTQDKVASAAGGLTELGSDAAQAARSINVGATTDGAKDELEGRVGQIKNAIDKLADRGEQIATDLRHDPILVRLISDADTGVEKAANQLTSTAQKLRARTAAQAKREAAGTTSTPVRLTPPAKVPTHKTTVRNTPAGEAPIGTTPTHRAAAEETATRNEAARKAAATRNAAAESAAATRKAAAEKAAATREEKAVARARATEVRKAAAVKAATTRKRTATKTTTRSATAKKASATTGRARKRTAN